MIGQMKELAGPKLDPPKGREKRKIDIPWERMTRVQGMGDSGDGHRLNDEDYSKLRRTEKG